jgi:hypothetical protein
VLPAGKVAAAAPKVTLIQTTDSGDGTVKNKLHIAWAAPSSTIPIKSYEVKINDGTRDVYKKTKNLSTDFEAAVGLTYTVSVSAISVSGVASAYTNSTVLAPSAKGSGPTAPSGPSSYGIPLALVVGWNQCPDADYAYSEIWFTASISTVPSVSQAAFFTVTQSNASAASYIFYLGGVYSGYAWVRHVNKSGVPSSWVQASGGFSTALIDATLIAPGAITYSKINDPAFLVRNATATLSYGDVGTYGFFKQTSGGLIAAGGTTAGSNLAPTDTGLNLGSGNPSGTWQAMSRVVNNQAGLFMRVS